MKVADEKTAAAESSTVEDNFYPDPKKADPTPAPEKVEPQTSAIPPVKEEIETEPEPEPGESETEPTVGGEHPKTARRIARLLNDRAHYRARAELYEKQLAEKNAVPAAAKVETPPTDHAKPKSEDFATFEEYLDARDNYNRSAWEKEKVEKQKQTEAEKAQAKAKAESDQHAERFNKREAVVMAKSPNYEQHFKSFMAVAGPGSPLTIAVFESEISADIADHLGAHPDELAKFAKLTPGGVWKAIGILEDKLQAAQAKGSTHQITQAPPPLGDVSGTASAQGRELTMEEKLYGKNT